MTSPRLHQLVYVSRNVINGTAAQLEAELEQILAMSRRNNALDGVTGALLYNADCFAQVLEGDLVSVQSVFERIQTDRRHRQTVVLQSGPVTSPSFGEWSMAYGGRIDQPGIRFDVLVRERAADAVLGLLRGVLHRAEAVE